MTPTSDFVLTLRACHSSRWVGPDAEVLHLNALHWALGCATGRGRMLLTCACCTSASEDSFRQPEKDLPASDCSLEYIQKRNNIQIWTLLPAIRQPLKRGDAAAQVLQRRQARDQITKSQRSMLRRRQSTVRARLLIFTMQMLCGRPHLQRSGLPTAALPCLFSCIQPGTLLPAALGGQLCCVQWQMCGPSSSDRHGGLQHTQPLKHTWRGEPSGVCRASSACLAEPLSCQRHAHGCDWHNR